MSVCGRERVELCSNEFLIVNILFFSNFIYVLQLVYERKGLEMSRVAMFDTTYKPDTNPTRN